MVLHMTRRYKEAEANCAPTGGSAAREPDGPPLGRTAGCEARGLSNRPRAWGDPESAAEPVAGGIGALVAAELDPAYRRRVETVVEWLPPSADERSHIVDIGCGRGYFAHYYATLGQHAITGVEIDAVVATRAAATHAAQPRVAIIRADATALPLGTATCSGAILSEVLEHVGDDAAVLRETLRVLRAGAIAAITVPHVNFPWAWDPINRTLQSMRLQPVRKGPLAGIWAGHVRLYDIDALRRVVQGAGFVIDEERAMVRHCLPFSHNLLYGIGKPLLESGWLPATIAGTIDRARSPNAGPSRIAADLRRLLALRDGRNRVHEGFDVPSVGLAIKARKPG
jgi:SAM-dependent methyltransferase